MNPAPPVLHSAPKVAGTRRLSAGPATFGAHLRHLRRAAGLTQQALASRAGYSTVYIGMLERGERVATPATSDLLADALSLPAHERALLRAALRGGGRASALHLNTSALQPLVGREDELTALDLLLSGVGPSALVLAGEPGIGKTRLLYEAIGRGAERGWTVLQAGCQRGSVREAFAPLSEAIVHHLQAQSARLVRTQLVGCTWLARAVPEVAAFGLTATPIDVLPPERERRLVFGAAMRFIDNVAGPAGTLLVLDDLQWAGPDALDLLVALLHAPHAVPVRIVLGYRTTEVQLTGPLPVALDDLAAAGLMEQRTMTPLDHDGAHRLLTSLLAGRPEIGGDLRQRLIQRTGGVPFFVVSCAQALLTSSNGRAAGEVPWNMAQSIRQRAAALPPSTRTVLDMAAVIGRHVPRPVLMASAGQSEDAVLTALEALGRVRLLDDEGDGYRFAHDVIHEVVAADLSATRRLVLHRRVAEALEREQGPRAAEVIALHYLESDATERAWPYLEMAGDEAQAAAAHASAERHYHALVESMKDRAAPLVVARVQERLGVSLLALDRYDEAIAELERAATIYWTVTAHEDLGRIVARIGHGHGRRGTPDVGIARVEEVLAIARTRPHGVALAPLYATLAYLYFLSGRYADELAAATMAAEYARASGDDRSLTVAQNRRGTALFSLGRLDDALPPLQEADRLAETVGDLDVAWRVQTNLGLVYFARGDFVSVQAHAERAVKTALRLGDALPIARTLANRGEGAMYRGAWAAARADFAAALAHIRGIGATEATAYPLLDLAHLCLLEGRWDEMERYVDEGRRLGERTGDLQILRWAGGLLAERDILRGYPEQARERFDTLLDRQDEGTEETDVTYILPVLAWSCLEMDDTACATATAAAALRRAREQEQRVALVDALRVSAMIACGGGDAETARAHLDEALDLAQTMPYPYAEARLWHVDAEACLVGPRSADLDAARASLEAALNLYNRLGAQPEAARARDDLMALPYRRHMRSAGLILSQGRWARVQAVLPSLSRRGRPRADDRRTLEAILYVRRRGCAWADLPPEFGDDATTHRRYRQWQATGVWPRIVAALGPLLSAE